MRRVSTTAVRRQLAWIAPSAIAVLAMAPPALGQAAPKPPAPAPAATTQSATVDRIRKAGRLKLGYRTDARPFSYRDEAGNPAGFTVDLCRAIGESAKTELGVAGLTVDWVPVTAQNRLAAVRQGEVDLLCSSETVTLEARKEVSFSVPVFLDGASALVRADAQPRLRGILLGQQIVRPHWRAVALDVLREQTFAVVPGGTAEQWLSQRRDELKVESTIATVADYPGGVQAVLDRKANAFFGQRGTLLDLAKRSPSAAQLVVIDRLYTFEPTALALPRGDDDFRLAVDRTLSRVYSAPDFMTTYRKWFGEPDARTVTFYQWNALPK